MESELSVLSGGRKVDLRTAEDQSLDVSRQSQAVKPAWPGLCQVHNPACNGYRMRAHYLRHVPFEGPGMIEPWLGGAGYEVTNTPFFRMTELPDLESIDLLIVMGGPMSVNDEGEFPWLVQEKQFIHSAMEAGKPVLGVCLV